MLESAKKQKQMNKNECKSEWIVSSKRERSDLGRYCI